MAGPSTNHSGFLIPNASGVADPLLAEPDKIDFNTLGNARWGVLSGCEVSGSGATSVAVSDGTAMVNGKFVYVEGTTVSVSIPSGSSKFDLIVVDDQGVVSVREGRESTDPVYPDPLTTQTVLAAVYCKTGLNIADYVIDKRKFLQPALLTKIGPTADLIRNFANPGATSSDPLVNYVRMYGDGHIVWLNDTHLYRRDVGSLQVKDNLAVTQDITADEVTARLVTATDNVTGLNMRRETSFPSSKRKGDILVRTDLGTAYIANPDFANTAILEWDEIATFGNMLPVGTVLWSLESVTKMQAKGWLALNGQRITEYDYPRLFKIAALSYKILAGTIAPNRVMNLPNFIGRMPMNDYDAADVGKAGPSPGGNLRANNQLILTKAQMPKHNHGVNATAQAVKPNGVLPNHSHPNLDDGHDHRVGLARISGATLTPTTNAGFGSNYYDAVLTPMVDANCYQWTQNARAEIQVSGSGTTPIPLVMGTTTHDHDMLQTEEGQGAAVDVTNNYFNVSAFIRS